MKKENNYFTINSKINCNNVYNIYNYNYNFLKIRIQDKEYIIDDQNLIQALKSLMETNGGYNSKNKLYNNLNVENDDIRELKKQLYSFPREIDKNTLEFFINLLSLNLDKNVALCSYIRKLINICIELQLYDIIEKEVNEYLLPIISKENCIELVINFIDLVFQEKIQKYFINLIKTALLNISNYLPDFIINKKEILSLLSNETLEEIIEIYFENKNKLKENNIDYNNNTGQEQKNNKNVMDLLMKIRNINNDIFSLLEYERKNALKNFELCINEDKDYKPKFIWKLKFSDITNEIYQEYKLCIDNINLLLICYYEPEIDTFQFALQVIGTNLISSSENINNKENINDINLELNDINNRTNNNYLNIMETISILYLCEIPEINFKSKINFNCIQQKCNSKFLIFKLENFSKLIDFSNNTKKTKDFSINFYFTRNYIFSSIIDHIGQNLELYHRYLSVNKIPKLALSIILKNDNIIDCQKNEAYKIQLIQNWLKNKSNYNNKNILDLFKYIKWRNLSTNDLLDFFIYNSKLLISLKDLKNDIFYEIQRRFQNEYFSTFKNYNYKYTESNDESIKISNTPINQNIEKSNSFTFDFLSRLLTYFSVKNLKEVNNDFSFRSFQNFNHTNNKNEENICKLIKQKNKNYNDKSNSKISKSIRLKEYPFYNSINQNDYTKENKHLNLIKRNNYTNNNNYKSNNLNKNASMTNINYINSNKNKSSKSSIISKYHDLFKKNMENNKKYDLIQKINKKPKLSDSKMLIHDIQNLTKINANKSTSLIVNKLSDNNMRKKIHSNSLDKNKVKGNKNKKSKIRERNKINSLYNFMNYNEKENGQNKYINIDKSLN